MKTTTRTTLPDSTHEQPVHELKLSKWIRYLFYLTIVLISIACCLSCLGLFIESSKSPPNQSVEELVIFGAFFLLGYIIMAAVVTATALLFGDIYFYEQHVEMRRFLPFIKRHVIYYNKMHVHIMKSGVVVLNYYETRPKFWKSPNAWFKANFLVPINIPSFSNPEIREFVKTKAQSINVIETSSRSVNPIKTPARTTLPGNEQPIYELKHPSRYQETSRSFKCLFYFLAFIFLFGSVLIWRVNVSGLIKAGGPEMVIGLVIVVIYPLACIMVLASMIGSGYIYFYERYVEIRRFLPFMKRLVIYYDKMHVHIGNMGRVTLNHYEAQPKLWKSPYIWFKANFFDVIYFPLNYDFEILEFVKTKAQSVNYYNRNRQKLG